MRSAAVCKYHISVFDKMSEALVCGGSLIRIDICLKIVLVLLVKLIVQERVQLGICISAESSVAVAVAAEQGVIVGIHILGNESVECGNVFHSVVAAVYLGRCVYVVVFVALKLCNAILIGNHLRIELCSVVLIINAKLIYLCLQLLICLAQLLSFGIVSKQLLDILLSPIGKQFISYRRVCVGVFASLYVFVIQITVFFIGIEISVRCLFIVHIDIVDNACNAYLGADMIEHILNLFVKRVNSI